MHRHALRTLIPTVALAACLLTGCTTQEQARFHLVRGDSALERDDLEAALAEFREAVQLNPELIDAHIRMGEIYKKQGKLPEAANSLETAVRLDPRRFEPLFELGEVYQLLRELAKAIQTYLLACNLEPRNFEARYRLATCYHQNGELDSAVESYEKALELDPRSGKAWSNLGAAQDARGRFYEAINAYKQALELEVDQPVVLVNLATVYLNQERYPAARQTLEAAIRLAPELSIAFERLGYCNWREGRLDDAISAYRESAALDPRNARAQAGLGVVLMTRYLRHPDEAHLRREALDAWHRSLESEPQQPRLRALVDKYRIRGDQPEFGADVLN